MSFKINVFLLVLTLSSIKFELIHEFENFIEHNNMNESFVRSVSTWQIEMTVTLPKFNL